MVTETTKQDKPIETLREDLEPLDTNLVKLRCGMSHKNLKGSIRGKGDRRACLQSKYFFKKIQNRG